MVSSRIPSFFLYGEAAAPGQELLHIEEVQSRSRLYHWEISPHVHQGLYQVLWLQRGQAEVMLDEWTHRVSDTAAIVVPPGVVHGFRFAPGTDGMVLTLSARFLVEGDFQSVGRAFQSLFVAPRVLRFAGDPSSASDVTAEGAGAPVSEDILAAQRLHALLVELAHEFAQPGASESPVPGWLARAVVWRLAQVCARHQEQQGERGHRYQALFTRFLVLLEQHFLEHWPIERYASQLGLSTQRLNRLTRAECGRSALELIHERLTREACRRLTYIAAPVASLAIDLGFDDPAYFSRFFKRRTGVSPARWRQDRAPSPLAESGA